MIFLRNKSMAPNASIFFGLNSLCEQQTNKGDLFMILKKFTCTKFDCTKILTNQNNFLCEYLLISSHTTDTKKCWWNNNMITIRHSICTKLVTAAKIDLDKKSLLKQKTIQNFTIDAQRFRKTRNENPPVREIEVTS